MFIALGGGAYALTLPNNSVKSKHIKNGQVKGVDVNEGTLGQVPSAATAVNAQNATTAGGISCGSDPNQVMVKVGPFCIDKYEASVWDAPTGGNQLGVSTDDYPCDDEGQDCKAGTSDDIYARSVAGVTPSGFITYFQAQQALANSGKRLPTNAEWQQAVAGTPDSAACTTGSLATTGANACISHHGANDMVGNLQEWVADWVPRSTTCLNWDTTTGTFSSDDDMCLAGADATNDVSGDGPGALARGGGFSSGALAGPFSVVGIFRPSDTIIGVGFRGAR